MDHAGVELSRQRWHSERDLLLRWCSRLILVILTSLVLHGIQVFLYVQKANEATVEVRHIYLDADGRVLWRGEEGSWTLRDVSVVSRLSDWIVWVRSRPPALPATQALVKRDWQRAYDMTAGEARPKLNAWMETADPMREENASSSIEVQITSVGYLIQDQHYEMAWTERRVDTKQRLVEETKWTARLAITRRDQQSPRAITVKEANTNDLGIWVQQFTWWQETPRLADGRPR